VYALLMGILPLGAVEISQGQVRLILHENSARFSLYGLNSEDRYEPFFSAQDNRTSFAAVNVDDRIYRMGESFAFRFRIEDTPNSPAFVFESAFLHVRQEFRFIQTAGSSVSNGIQITFRIKNVQPRQIKVGLRVLLDTHLGEGFGKTPFFINNRGIGGETLMDGGSENRWVSRNETLSLMGSISAPGGKSPDTVHFANWKRLNEAPWKSNFSNGRNFNYPPYSIGDSAVCYYYDPVSLSQDQELSYTIILASEDPAGFERLRMPDASSVVEQAPVFDPGLAPIHRPQTDFFPDNSRESDLALLRSLMDRLDKFLSGEIDLSEEELAVMELTITLLKARYNLP
jgi:hypothetical protein